ncbi:unnamed protein product [Oikopleura dioica]|uniref:EGF-like domain-containing protein n=1 Tax=Oikopleura dioica TaxID=34765 RepID=E4Y560_OIKDI|nr:unnamed protein product [Oikopleura dioica]
MLSRSRKFLLFLTVAVLLGALCSILSVPILLSKSTSGNAESTEHADGSTAATGIGTMTTKAAITTSLSTISSSTKTTETATSGTASKPSTTTASPSTLLTSNSTPTTTSGIESETSTTTTSSTTQSAEMATSATTSMMTESTTTTVLTTTAISPCEIITCLNNGTCIEEENNNQAECNCTEPFFGDHCERHRCNEHICHNRGFCSFDEVLQEAKCSCFDPFIGDHCEIHACDGIICENGGTCSVENGDAKCYCIEPFFGDNCEKHRCNEHICRNKGVCSFDETLQEAKCSCIDPYVGDNCEINACDDINCQNGGTCYLEDKLPKCKCEVSYSGENCECPPLFVRQKESQSKFLKISGNAAKDHCSGQGGFLTFFINKEEFDEYITNQRENAADEWIGYIQKFPDNNNLYTTVDGEDARFLKWADDPDEPNNKDTHWVELYGANPLTHRSNKMNDLSSKYELEFSCRFSQNGNCP